MSPFIIETDHLGYAYRKARKYWALKSVDLQIRPNEYILICGSSGSGKSTLCRTFNGLIPHFYEGTFKGEVRIAGRNTVEQSVRTLFSQVGMIFQNPEAQLFSQTVEGEIVFGLESLGLSRDEIRGRVNASAGMIKIEALLSRNPHELSGGEQQLVSIAAIMALKPQIIILDEPYANLDPVNVDRVRAALKKIHRSGMGVIICEHRLPLTIADVQRVVVLHDGCIVVNDPPEKAMQQDLTPFGLESPLAVSVGQRLKLRPIPLDLTALKAAVPAHAIPPGLLPKQPRPPADDAPFLLEVDQISFQPNHAPVLRNIDFKLRQGESLAIVGANGAGKTTLLKHLNGLYRPSQGRVRVMGHSTHESKVSQLAQFVGIAFQNPNSQFFKLTVWDEIIVGAQSLNRFDKSWAQELVRLFRLEPLLERAPYRLSEGEKKRVAFAAALAAKPMLLVLDEPTAGQDLFFRLALGRLLSKLRSQGQAIIIVTQDLAFAEQHTHRWLLMADGRIVADGPPGEVMANTEAMRNAKLKPTEYFHLYHRHDPKRKKMAPVQKENHA